MKKLSIIIAAFIMIAGFSTSTFAQVTTTAPTAAGAKIVSALSLTETSALHFGTMAIPTTDATVILTFGGARSNTGTIALLAQTPTATAAAYTVGGDGTATYAITLPSVPVVISNGTQTMNVTSFTSSKGSSSALVGGADTFTVGATLNLVNSQAAGTYAGTFNVYVNYN